MSQTTNDVDDSPREIHARRWFSAAANSSYAQNENYRAKLDGNNEVPPVKFNMLKV